MKQKFALLSAKSEETHFKLVSGLMRLDNKKRVSLGAAFSGSENVAVAYNIYKNAIGQIVLDPVRVIPESEVWLYNNKVARQTMENGLRQVDDGEVEYLGSFKDFLAEEHKNTHTKKTQVHGAGKRKPQGNRTRH